MKALILSVMTLTLLYSAHQADSNKPQFEKTIAGVYQVSALDILDPSWPKLA